MNKGPNVRMAMPQSMRSRRTSAAVYADGAAPFSCLAHVQRSVRRIRGWGRSRHELILPDVALLARMAPTHSLCRKHQQVDSFPANLHLEVPHAECERPGQALRVQVGDNAAGGGHALATTERLQAS